MMRPHMCTPTFSETPCLCVSGEFCTNGSEFHSAPLLSEIQLLNFMNLMELEREYSVWDTCLVHS